MGGWDVEFDAVAVLVARQFRAQKTPLGICIRRSLAKDWA